MDRLDALIEQVQIGKKQRATAGIRPPLASFAYFSLVLAPRGIEPRSNRGLIIRLRFNLDSGCSGSSDAMNIFPLEEPMKVTWDPMKARASLAKHGVRFSDAESVLFDPGALTREDKDAEGEQRFVSVGSDAMGRVLTVVYSYK
jgi:uncharacterized DUF497 family protein